jgi:hypothetical protein
MLKKRTARGAGIEWDDSARSRKNVKAPATRLELAM